MRHLITLFCLLFQMNAYSYDFKSGGIFYNIISDYEPYKVEVTYEDNSSLRSYTGDVVIPANVEYNNIIYDVVSIGEYAFAYCSTLLSITFPETIHDIKKYSFCYCSKLKNIVLPKSVLEIGENAFGGCSELEQVRIMDGVKKIGVTAFASCSSLKTIEIPNSVEQIGMSAFNKCTNLINIKLSQNLKVVGRNVFKNTAWYNQQPEGFLYMDSVLLGYKGYMPLYIDVEVENGTRIIAGGAFENCDMQKVILPNSVIGICRGAFSQCNMLEDINIPERVEFIDTLAFNECSVLQSKIVISKGTVNLYAFSGCCKLQELEIGRDVLNIGRYVFLGCSSLKQIHIKSQNICIDEGAFLECGNIEKIIIDSESIPMTEDDIFDNTVYNNAILYVREYLIEDFKKTDCWGNFVNIKSIKDYYVSGVNTPNVDNMPIEYYDLSGQRVYNPELGIFIKKQGSKTSKVILK